MYATTMPACQSYKLASYIATGRFDTIDIFMAFKEGILQWWIRGVPGAETSPLKSLLFISASSLLPIEYLCVI